MWIRSPWPAGSNRVQSTITTTLLRSCVLKQQKSCSSSKCEYLHYLVTSLYLFEHPLSPSWRCAIGGGWLQSPPSDGSQRSCSSISTYNPRQQCTLGQRWDNVVTLGPEVGPTLAQPILRYGGRMLFIQSCIAVAWKKKHNTESDESWSNIRRYFCRDVGPTLSQPILLSQETKYLNSTEKSSRNEMLSIVLYQSFLVMSCNRFASTYFWTSSWSAGGEQVSSVRYHHVLNIHRRQNGRQLRRRRWTAACCC